MSEYLKPPVIPTAILNWFSCQPDFPAVAGDLAEEFQQRVETMGATRAGRWYWWESFRNACALTARGTTLSGSDNGDGGLPFSGCESIVWIVRPGQFLAALVGYFPRRVWVLSKQRAKRGLGPNRNRAHPEP